MGVRGEGLFGSSVSVSAGEELSRRACGALCQEDRSYTITPVGHCAGRRGVTLSHLWGTVQAGAPSWPHQFLGNREEQSVL